jgi:hypothetical protein
MDNLNIAKIANVFECKKCDYRCCNRYDYNKHLLTRKHSMDKNDNRKSQNIATSYQCENCNATYKHQSGLCKHRKTCNIKPNVCSLNDENKIMENLVKELMMQNQQQLLLHKETLQQNQELQKQVIELCKSGTHNTITTTNTNTNCNNKAFNLNLFLNEQCKNAINLNEFMKNIEVSREDLMNTGQLGFVGGISKIIMDQLNGLGIHERPIHCTDLKRDVVYIKENNEWNKESDSVKLRSVIQEVSRKSMGTLINWKKENPDYADGDSRFSQDCINMHRNSIAGYERETLFPKVIRVINKEIVIDKHTES